MLNKLLKRLNNLYQRTKTFKRNSKRLGIRGAFKLEIIYYKTSRGSKPLGLWSIHLAGWPTPLYGRYGSSDLSVFGQIFIEEEHSWAKDLTLRCDNALILDCGANVGYATVYFARLFPHAKIIAVEPDAGNFVLLERNTAAFKDRILVKHAAVWSNETTLSCENRGFRDGKEWARQVFETSDSANAKVQAVTLSGLLAESQRPRIGILKMDIEGAEVVIFGCNCLAWLDYTDAIAIELHDDTHFGDASKTFHSAISSNDFHVGRSGELTIARRTFCR